MSAPSGLLVERWTPLSIASVAIAVGTVIEQSKDAEDY